MIKEAKFILLTLVVQSNLSAQQISRSSISSSGMTEMKGGIIIQQSVGQPALVSHINVDGTGLRQGFQQPIYFIEEQNDLNVNLYPNPNQGDFSFIVNEVSDASLSYHLFDQQGKLLFENAAISNELTPVSIQNPSPGMYHLKVTSGLKTSSFKINVIQ